MDVDKVCRGLDAIEQEAERRFGGGEPDRRFDLALDVVEDLADAVEREPVEKTVEGLPPGTVEP